MATDRGNPKLALVVVEAFNDYRKGDSVKDKTEIDKILASEHAYCVLKINIEELA